MRLASNARCRKRVEHKNQLGQNKVQRHIFGVNQIPRNTVLSPPSRLFIPLHKYDKEKLPVYVCQTHFHFFLNIPRIVFVSCTSVDLSNFKRIARLVQSDFIVGRKS